MNRLIQRVLQMGVQPQKGVNLIAFSGGVDSSVVAAAVYRTFPENTICVIGKSAALPQAQLNLAREVAKSIGVSLREIETKEGTHDEYLRNEGKSCYSCKTHLYGALLDLKSYITEIYSTQTEIRIFNGTNKDDKADATRVGLIAAKEYNVFSPIDDLTKDEVRACALEFNLPNHSYAASPCLRSRLAIGVRATSTNLSRIEEAENIVRLYMEPQLHNNIRVRHLKSGVARVEMDEDLLKSDALELLAPRLAELGFHGVEFAKFRSGSVAMGSTFNSSA